MNKKIITLGPKFSYSYNITTKYYQEDDIILANSISEIFDRITENTHGMVPIENILNGSVRETFLALQKGGLKIFKGVDYKIDHVLASQNENFSTIMSYTQPLIQCSKYISQLRQEEIEIAETKSSSEAMKKAQEDNNIAAIGSREAAEYYNLKIQKENISNKENNITRFIEIGKGEAQQGGEKTSLIISPETDRSGLLFEILAVFKIKELNLTKIESIATGKGMNNYIFYIDIDSSLENSRMQEAIKFLQTFVKINTLGSYNIEDLS
jgi:prephenate dehydratase